MRTNKRRLMHVTFASGVLVLAMATATPTLAASGLDTKLRPVAARAGEIASPWARLTRAALWVILRCAAPAPVKDALPLGVVVDDGVPF